MQDSNSKWDRQELYEKVWQVPLRKLATEYGVSDVALGKVCRKLQIPLPGPGHWTKIECGHTIPRPALPEVKDLPVLLRQVREEKAPLLSEDSPELDRIDRIERCPTPSLTKAMLANPLIEKTRQGLREARTTDRGMLWGGHEVDWLDVRVSKDCLTRALRIMAAIVFMLEQEGFQLVVEKRRSESTSAIVLGESIRFGLVEKSRQVKAAPAPNAKSSSIYNYNPIRLEPTGILSIEVWSYYSVGAQKTWRDRDNAPLEAQLPKFVAGMVRIALRKRADQKAQEEREQARQKKIDEVTEILDRIEAEEKKIKTLKKEAVAWHRAERIRKYAAAVRERAEAKTDASERAKILEWTDWAERQADRIDPLKESPPSIIDDKAQVLERLKSVRWSWYSS